MRVRLTIPREFRGGFPLESAESPLARFELESSGPDPKLDQLARRCLPRTRTDWLTNGVTNKGAGTNAGSCSAACRASSARGIGPKDRLRSSVENLAW